MYFIDVLLSSFLVVAAVVVFADQQNPLLELQQSQHRHLNLLLLLRRVLRYIRIVLEVVME